MTRAYALARSALLILLLAGAGGYYLYARTPCHTPIAYSVGALDPRFDLSEQELLDATVKAAALWEDAAGENLFEYKKGGSLPINLVYDSRQETTQHNSQLSDAIDSTVETADSVKAAYNAAQAKYKAASAAYFAAQAQYQSALAEYNAQVEYWNVRGGAPQSEYKALRSQKAALEERAGAVEQLRLESNTQAQSVNALSARYNELASKANATITVLNQTANREFEEGLYVRSAAGARIDIYEFRDKGKLVRVLAHELGHALGLEHNHNPESLMYEINQSDNTEPTAEDLAALKAACGVPA